MSSHFDRLALASGTVRDARREHRNAQGTKAINTAWKALDAAEREHLAARQALSAGVATMPTDPGMYGEIERDVQRSRPIEKTTTGSLFGGREHDAPGQQRIDELGGPA